VDNLFARVSLPRHFLPPYTHPNPSILSQDSDSFSGGRSVYEYIKRYPALKGVLSEAREGSLDLAESKLMEAINAGNLTAIIFFLKTQGKKRGYVERSEHDLRSAEAPIKFTIKIGEPRDKL